MHDTISATLEPLGDAGWLVRLGTSRSLNPAAVALAQRVRDVGLPGVVDVVPAWATVAVLWDPTGMPTERWRALRTSVEALLLDLASHLEEETGEQGRLVELPVCYGGSYGQDLEDLAQRFRITAAEIVRRHSAPIYRVAFLGFLPGFPYLEGLDSRLAAPRHPTPRAKVPAGSVGIAGHATGIYPQASPGGWQLVGLCPTPLFDPTSEFPALLRAGDRVRFVPFEHAPTTETPIKMAAAGDSEATASGGRQTEVAAETFEVLSPGFLSTLQDRGRPGFGASGLAPGGALDLESHTLANWLVGNHQDAATLEVLVSGPRLRCLRAVEIALVGAEFELNIDGQAASTHRPVEVPAGAMVEIGRLRAAGTSGCRSYLAVGGGFRGVHQLGSCSWHTAAGLGTRLVRGQALAVGARPAGAPASAGSWSIPRRVGGGPSPLGTTLRMVPADAFPQGDLANHPFTVSQRADRMALILERVAANVTSLNPSQAERDTEPVAFGTIQLLPDGNLAIVLADRQTTGGYPRLGEIAAVDRSALAQLSPGHSVSFESITVDAALTLAADRHHELERLAAAIGRRRNDATP